MRTPDNDGFSVADGDCDDFAELVNPGAYDIPGNGIDEDCQDGDAPTADCDAALDVADADPLAAARAIELCPVTDETSKRWGVISARWTTPDGKGEPGGDMMHGLLPGLGPSFTPRGGTTLLALSSGVARAPGQPGATHDCSDSFPADSHLPAGFDRTSSTCELTWEDTTVVDAIALELRVRMPTNVQAFGFDSAFFTDEYPDFICSPFNDFFQVIVEPMRKGGSRDGNVLFDQDGNAVSVNNSLLRVCSPGQHGGKDFDCPLGFMPLVGTGFEDCAPSGLTPGGLFGDLFGDSEYGASTGWVNTELAVTPGEIITLRFTIWDSGDSALDSLALIDHVQFRFRDAPPPPEMPMTTPINPD
ncbi:MAG: choice-of-anchor L domain-containing protein [Polyangiales bacterium]